MKNGFEKAFLSDTEEAPVHSFRSSSRQRVCWEREVYDSVEFYLKDGLEKLFIGDHGEGTLCIIRSPERQSHWVYMIVLHRRWSWKGSSFVAVGKAILCSFIVQVFQETELLEWMCLSCKDWFWTISTCRGDGSLKGLILKIIYFERVWWSWKELFLQFLIWESGSERTDFQ